MTPRTTVAPRHRPASDAGRALRRGRSPRAPRRVSGPARPAFAGSAAARPSLPLRLTLRLTTKEEADKLQQRSGAERLDDHTIGCDLTSQHAMFHWTTGAR